MRVGALREPDSPGIVSFISSISGSVQLRVGEPRAFRLEWPTNKSIRGLHEELYERA